MKVSLPSASVLPIEYASETACNYSIKAKESLKNFQESAAKEALLALVDFVINRKN